MSQTTAPSAPSAPPAPAGPSPFGRAIGALRAGLAGSPGRLRAAAGLAIVAALVAGIGGAAALRDRSQALADARDTAADVVLLQGIRTALAEADANATNSFLLGGLEPVGQRRAYVQAVSRASSGLAELSRSATTADAETLGRVNAQLTRYTGLVEAARANNRVDLPVGASYLKVASGLLQDDNETEAANDGILPALTDLATSYTAQVDADYDRAARASLWLALAAIFGLGGLIAIQIWLARQSRRVISVPAALGTAVLLVAYVIAAAAMALAQGQTNEVRNGDYAEAEALGRARVAAFDAKSQEALTLISRGSGTLADERWAEPFGDAERAVREAGTPGLAEQLAAYRAQHEAIRQLDLTRGDWDGAVQAATSQANPSANSTFAAFAVSSEDALARSAAGVFSGLEDARGGLLFAGLLVLLAGLVAAAGAWWGISLRLDEYR